MKYINISKNHYFAAANTAEGFKSLFDEVFNKKECEKLYILKGGPGVGKSTFMKKAASLCEEQGLTVEYLHCSSDPDSLDGILIKEKKIAIADGTSPHSIEATLAGAFEEIIDLGKAWDTEGLYAKKDILQKLSDEKKACYRDAYDTLDAYKRIRNLLQKLCSPFVNTQKLTKSVSRLAKSILPKGSSNEAKTDIRLTNALSCKGKIRFGCFENNADMCIFIKDSLREGMLSQAYLNELYKTAQKKGADMLVSLSPLDISVVDGLYFTKEKISVTRYCDELVDMCDKSGKKCRIINTSRFVDGKGISSIRRERRFYEKLALSLEEKALQSLAKAGQLHFKLEEVYSEHTDYSKVEKMQTEFFKKLFKHQTPRQ